MEKKPLISVCIVTYRHKDYIGKCLDSILSQKGNFSLEILLHDDASTDGSEEVLSDYQDHAKVSHILLNEHNTGNIRRSFFLSYRQKISIPRGKEILPEFLISPEPRGNTLP